MTQPWFAKRYSSSGRSWSRRTAVLVWALRWDHGDPFDRLLVAQATLEELVLVTVDAAITALPVPRVLTW